MGYGIKLHIWGERACFTRPEMKVERVSYDVITPSAAACWASSRKCMVMRLCSPVILGETYAL